MNDHHSVTRAFVATAAAVNSQTLRWKFRVDAHHAQPGASPVLGPLVLPERVVLLAGGLLRNLI